MAMTKRQLEAATQAWAKRVSYTIGGLLTLLMDGELGDAERERVAGLVRAQQELFESLEDHLFELRRARRGDPVKLFAGTWPPRNPLDMLAMRETLLADFDELHAIGGYLSEDEGEDFGEGRGPMGSAFAEVDRTLHALHPGTTEAATAIHFAAMADEALGFGDRWEKRQRPDDEAQPLPALPRPL